MSLPRNSYCWWKILLRRYLKSYTVAGLRFFNCWQAGMVNIAIFFRFTYFFTTDVFGRPRDAIENSVLFYLLKVKTSARTRRGPKCLMAT